MKKVYIKISIMLLIFMVVFTASAYCGFIYITPVSVVKLGDNPSVLFSLNKFDMVISVNSSDENIDYLVSNLNIKHKRISKSVDITIAKLNESGFILINDLNSDYLKVSNSNKNKEKQLTQLIEENVKNSLNEIVMNNKLEASVEIN